MRNIFLLFCCLLLSCRPEAQQTVAKPDLRLRLGYFPNITHAQALYAQATGEFEKTAGVPIDWVKFNDGPAAIEALFINAVDATYIGPSPTINGYTRSRGEKFVIVSGSASGGAGLVVRRDSGIDGERDFDRKIIATPQMGNTQDLAARAWFANKGYRLKERGGTVVLLPLANSDQLTMLKKKQIDGAWTVEPWLSRLELEGEGRLFLDEKTLWPGGRYVTTHLIVTRKFLDMHPELVKKLLTAHIEVTQRINADKGAAVKVLNAQLKKITGKALKAEVIKRALDHVEFTWDPIVSSMRKSTGIAHKMKFIKTEPNLEKIYSLTLLNASLREKNLPEVKEPDR